MGNYCLVTKLKEAVQNDNLLKMGECILTARTAVVNNGLYLKPKNSGSLDLAFSTPVSIYTADWELIESNVSSYTATTVVKIALPVNTDVKIHIIKKGDIQSVQAIGDVNVSFNGFDYLDSLGSLEFNTNGVLSNLDINFLKESDNINYVNIKNGVGGDINAVSGKNLSEFRIYNASDVYGDIEAFSACTKITILIINTTNITGSVDNLLDALAASGKTTTISSLRISDKVTFSKGGAGSYSIVFSNGTWDVAS